VTFTDDDLKRLKDTMPSRYRGPIRGLLSRLEAAEKDAARWNWMLDRMSGKDVMIFAQRPAGRADYCEEIVSQIDKAMQEVAG